MHFFYFIFSPSGIQASRLQVPNMPIIQRAGASAPSKPNLYDRNRNESHPERVRARSKGQNNVWILSRLDFRPSLLGVFKLGYVIPEVYLNILTCSQILMVQ